MILSVISIARIHYHPCPRALGEYNYKADIIILHEGLKKYREIHDCILKHEREHARIFKENRGLLKRLVLNIKLDYKTRISGATKIPLELLNELSPLTLKDSVYQTMYILAYIPILLIEGIYYTIKGIFTSNVS